MSANLTVTAVDDLNGVTFGATAQTGIAVGGGILGVGNVSFNNGLGVGLTHNNNGNYLLLGISHGYPATAGDIETSVTFNSVSMTKIGDSGETSFGRRVTVWALANPTTGSFAFAITEPTGGFKEWVLSAVSMVDANVSTPIGTVVTALGTGATATVDASSASGEMVVDFISAGASTPVDVTAIAVGAGQTQRVNANTGSGAGTNVFGGCSTESGSATTTMSWSITSGGVSDWNIVAVPVKP